MGPGAGARGGQIVFQGSVDGLVLADTPTARALRSRSAFRGQPRGWTKALTVTNAERHNLRGMDVEVPTDVLTVITGVAGSGKSSLVDELLAQHPGGVVVDQAGAATNRRSNTATYTGIADPIRKLFARANNVSASLFSANSDGACPQCRGLGVVYTDLAFMEGVVATCGACEGGRFTDEVLNITVKGRTIADILDSTVDEARPVLHDERVSPVLTALADVGLGYLTLGQPLSTLSGGECQRLKLATELHRSPTNALYVLDEPTTGLHRTDVAQLMTILDRLVDGGNTVVIVEHNLDVIQRADWVIDLGPGAGHHGGRVLFSGTPGELRDDPTPLTAQYLRKLSLVKIGSS